MSSWNKLSLVHFKNHTETNYYQICRLLFSNVYHQEVRLRVAALHTCSWNFRKGKTIRPEVLMPCCRCSLLGDFFPLNFTFLKGPCE